MAILNSLLLIYFLSQTSTTATKPKKIVTKLIHQYSTYSPFYNPKHSIKDRADRTLKSSLARFDYLQRKTESLKAEMVADRHGFLVNISVGDPPVPQLVVLDTGSRLLWIQCKPCRRCFDQKTPLYDSSSSSSFVNLPCNHLDCGRIPDTNCNEIGDCIYRVAYMDSSHSIGQIGTEKITFSTLDDGLEAIDSVIFGCGQDNHFHVHGGSGSGILGIGLSPTSIVNKIGFRFSYCIGNFNDPNYQYNHLILGNSAIFEGYSTGLHLSEELYYLSLEGISVGEERLEIDSDLFRRKWNGEGGTIIDSGSELTVINEVAYEVVRDKVESYMDGILGKYWILQDTKRLCYFGKIGQDLVGFPTATFHFSGGADLVLESESLFYQVNDDAFCLALLPCASNRHSVIGMLAQQYYNVGYDLLEEKIYFQRINCEALLD